MKITIAQLYPRDMNLYGDWGNTLVLKKRLERRGFEVEIIDHNPGDSTDFSKIDIFVGGGGCSGSTNSGTGNYRYDFICAGKHKAGVWPWRNDLPKRHAN